MGGSREGESFQREDSGENAADAASSIQKIFRGFSRRRSMKRSSLSLVPAAASAVATAASIAVPFVKARQLSAGSADKAAAAAKVIQRAWRRKRTRVMALRHRAATS